MAVLVLEIVISLLAVFGLYAAVRFFCAFLLAPPQLAVALEIKTPVGAEEAAFLYCRAKEFLVGLRAPHIVVCVSDTLEEKETIKAHFERLGAICCIVNAEKGG